MRKTPALILSAVIVLIAVGTYVVIKKVVPAVTVTIPEYREPEQVVELTQGWSDAQRFQFHHTAQGAKLVPFAWFMALEQPCFKLSACEKFSDPKYLSRFGFLPSKHDDALNPGTLPVGFAYEKDFHDPIAGKNYPALGLTCAACHTGELHYGKYAVRIEGGPAMIEVTQFQKALGLAMGFTQKFPFRFGRFASSVLGPNASDADKAQLKKDFDELLAAGMTEKNNTEVAYANQAGFARTDALARIGNQVFAVDMNNYSNVAPASAPVRFPQIWDASWFTWVQYNSSIADPMLRNIGEALGVRAVAKLYGPDATDYANSVDVEGLHTVETLLAGPAPYKGLSSPKWPAVFPALDQAKVTKGAALYRQHCASCHLPSPDELTADLNSPKPKYWWKNALDRTLLKITDVPVAVIGTDPQQAKDFMERKANTFDLKKGIVTAGTGLDIVTSAIVTKYYDKMSFSPEKRNEWNGFHDPKDPAARAIPVYKARPLNGIWAVAPYLHNGSVPNLYALLSPKEERKSFWLGSKEYDPVKVGYDPSELTGGYLLDTTKPGNLNTGHEFKDGPMGNGVIGPALSPDDRWALIEYLKSL